MTKESQAMLEAAAARVEQAIDVLEEAQEILAQDEEDSFEFPVGIIFSAQTSLRVVSELVRDVRKQAAPAKKQAGKKKTAKKGAKTTGAKGGVKKTGAKGAKKR